MIKKLIFCSSLLFLAYGLWLSPDFSQIAAGVAIFLFGMLFLEQGFQGFTGGTLERILRVSTNKRWRSLMFGMVSTTLMQSSSLVTVITISFLSVGILDLAAGIGIIFGANLGTTTGAWLIAGLGLKVKIAAYAMPMLIFGILLVFQKNKALKAVGSILAGMGFLFLGIHYMKEGFDTFRDTINLAEYALTGIKGLFVFTLIGIGMTVIMQSSHAAMVLIITALSVQQITYENALALAIGSNIGTTVTAIIGSMSANITGKRLAVAHLLFNLVTAIIAIFMLEQFTHMVDSVASAMNIAANDATLKLAIFHSLFNLAGIVIMLPFIDLLVHQIEHLLKGEQVQIDRPKYLNDEAMKFPDTVVLAVHKETVRLYRHASHIILKTLGLSSVRVFSEKDLHGLLHINEKIAVYDVDKAYKNHIKDIYSEVIAFISQASFTWEMKQSGKLYWLRESNRHIVEAIKDCKQLQHNLLLMNSSKNTFIQQEYYKIRYQIAELLRELDVFRLQMESDEAETAVLSFDVFKVKIKEQDAAMNEQIDQLIREHKITAAAGTSLINDSAYMYAIKRHLVDMAETIFVIQEYKLSEAERSIALDDNELDEVLKGA